MAGKPFQSKLEPHRDFIEKARREGKSYVKIANLLLNEEHLKVAPSTIYSFVKVRSRRRRVVTMLPDETIFTPPPARSVSPPPTDPSGETMLPRSSLCETGLLRLPAEPPSFTTKVNPSNSSSKNEKTHRR